MSFGGGSSVPAQTTQIQRIEPPAEVKPLIREAAERSISQLRGFRPQMFPGSTVVPLSQQTEQGLGLIEQAASHPQLLQAAQQELEGTLSGQRGGESAQRAIDVASRGLVRNFAESQLPQTLSNFARVGRFGSDAFQRGLQGVGRDLQQQLGDVATKISFTTEQAERERQQRAAQLAPALAQAQLIPAENLLRVGGIREGVEQAKLQEDIDRFNQQQFAESRAIDTALRRAGVLSGTGGTTSAEGQNRTRGASGFERAAGGALTGLSIASALKGLGAFGGTSGSVLGGIASGGGALLGLLSDERAKENISKVGVLDNGAKIYKYNYKGSPVVHVGVLAQELEKIQPDAVNKDENGIKYVDYGKLD